MSFMAKSGAFLVSWTLMACAAPASSRWSDEVAPRTPTVPQREVSGRAGKDDLSSQATDPTASLMSLNVIGTYVGGYTDDGPGLDEHGFELTFRPVIPFRAWGAPNILRVTIPYQLDGRGDDRLGDVTVFDLVVFEQGWGRWGLGPIASFASDPKAPDDAAFGPALGAVARVRDDLNLGLFSQNLFASDTAVSQLQPIVAWQLGDGWALSAGDLQFTYDWERSRWLSVPLGFQLGVVRPVAGQPMRFAVNPQVNLLNRDGLEEWSVAVTITLLAPGS